MLHPSIKILSVIILAIAVNAAGFLALLIIAVALAALLIRYRGRIFWTMLRRIRWILLSLLLIFAFTTPGEYIIQWPWSWAPTYEGLNAGFMQFARLCIMLAGLSLLLATSVREDLIVGFYLLLKPLHRLGLNAERFAARLWLTLHYVEQAPQHHGRNNLLQRLISGTNETPSSLTQQIELTAPVLDWIDITWLTGMLIAGSILLCA
jgi:energy-coupling factor transporter transmembrane protein EcfT